MFKVMAKNEHYNKSENSDKIHISFSEFSLFSQCGHRHLLEKYLGIYQQPPSIHLYFGNAIHASIENFLKENWTTEQMVNFFRETFAKDMVDNMKDTADYKINFNHFLTHGENILKILNINNILSEYEIVAVEEPLYEPLKDKYYFKGFIDLVLRHKITKKYKIADWKTSTQPWYLKKKLKDEIFLCQMRFYKYFWAKKNKVSIDDIECMYIVLNRLEDKNDLNSSPGTIQHVEINSTFKEIKESLEKLAKSLRTIHVEHKFEKIKEESYKGCIFCPLKGGKHPLCDSNPNQYKHLLVEHKNKIKSYGIL